MVQCGRSLGALRDLNEIEDKARRLERVEEHHVTDATVGDGWRVDRDIILVAPVVHAFGVVDLPAHPVDHLGRRPYHSLLPLLDNHLVKDGRQSFLEHHLPHCYVSATFSGNAAEGSLT